MTDQTRRFELLGPERDVRIGGSVDSLGQAMILCDALLDKEPQCFFRYQHRNGDSTSAFGVSRRDGAWTYVMRQTDADFSRAEDVAG